MHSKTNYPAKKSISDLDVELEDNLEDDAYIKTLKFYLNELNNENFDFVFYVAGVDIHFNDRLGKLKISDDEKSAIETALSELEESIKGDDKEAIDTRVQNLSEKAQVLAQKAQEKATADGGESDKSEGNDDVVDADFEEVNEEK